MTTSPFDHLLTRYGTNLDEIKNAGTLDEWEVQAIERGDYGHLRLSSVVKRAHTIDLPEGTEADTLKAIISHLARLSQARSDDA